MKPGTAVTARKPTGTWVVPQRARWRVALAACGLVGGAPGGAFAQTPVIEWREDPRLLAPAPPTDWSGFVERFVPGALPLNPASAHTMLEDETLLVPFEVQSGVCYAVAAFGEGPTDVDVEVYSLEGVRLAQDVWPDWYPVARWCAERSGTVEVRIRAFTGSGQVRWAPFVMPASLDAAGSFDEISNRLLSARSRGAPAAEAVGEQWRATLPVPGWVDFVMDVQAGECAAVVAVGSSTVLDLDLSLLHGETELAGDYHSPQGPMVVSCAVADAQWTVRVFVLHGRGTVGAQRLRLP